MQDLQSRVLCSSGCWVVSVRCRAVQRLWGVIEGLSMRKRLGMLGAAWGGVHDHDLEFTTAVDYTTRNWKGNWNEKPFREGANPNENFLPRTPNPKSYKPSCHSRPYASVYTYIYIHTYTEVFVHMSELFCICRRSWAADIYRYIALRVQVPVNLELHNYYPKPRYLISGCFGPLG